MEKLKNNKTLLLLIVLSFMLVFLLIQIYSNSIWASNNIDSDVIRVWTIHGDTEIALKKILKGYEEYYPNTKFEVTAYKNEVYQTAISNALLTDNLPDMFFMWGNSKLERFVDTGVAFDITKYIKEYNIEHSLLEGRLSAFTFDNKTYALPIYGWTSNLFCNKRIFEENNLDYPTTYEELLEVSEQLKSKGIPPLITGGKEGWLTSLYYMNFVQEEGEANSIYEATKDSSVYEQPQFHNAAMKLNQLIQRGYFQDGYLEQDAYMASYLFAKGSGAMLLYGSWATSILESDISQVIGDVEIIEFPSSESYERVGGYVDTFVVNSMGAITKKEEYIKLYVSLMKDISDEIVNVNGGGLPVYKHQQLDKERYPLLYRCWELSKNKKLYPAYDQIMSEDQAVVYYQLLNELLAKEITEDEFILGLTDYME